MADNEQSQAAEVFMCRECGASFETEEALQRHTSEAHQRDAEELSAVDAEGDADSAAGPPGGTGEGRNGEGGTDSADIGFEAGSIDSA
jgi:hypothetical protein